MRAACIEHVSGPTFATEADFPYLRARIDDYSVLDAV